MVKRTSERVKIGAKVDESVYNEFKKFVQEKTGQKRGVLGSAVEAALKEYMSEGVEITGDVSNEDILRELREFRRAASDVNPPPPRPSEESNSSTGSMDSAGPSDPSLNPSEEVPPGAPASGEDDLSEEDSQEYVDGVPVPHEKPGPYSPMGDRVAWIISTSGVSGRVPFGTVEQLVEAHYSYSASKTREIAWRVCKVLAPSASDLPDKSEYLEDNPLDPPRLDSELREMAENRREMKYYTCPRKHPNGAWYRLDPDSKNSVNHQEPTERGDVEVYLRERGARVYAEDYGFTLIDDFGTDTASDSVSEEDFKEVSIDGATDADTTSDAAEEADEVFADLEGANRGRE